MTRVFTYRLLDFTCSHCQGQPKEFTKIAITDEIEMYVEWFCPNCKTERYSIVPFEVMARMKPDPPDPDVGKPTTNELIMLHKAGITWN